MHELPLWLEQMLTEGHSEVKEHYGSTLGLPPCSVCGDPSLYLFISKKKSITNGIAFGQLLCLDCVKKEPR